MLPPAHVELTWGVLQWLQDRGLFREADYRVVALAALLPDLVDKPLAVFAFPKAGAALLFAHTLLLHGVAWAVLAVRRAWRWLPYALAFSGHLVADRMWGFGQTLWWPFRGWKFHQWRHVGSPSDFLEAYSDIVREEPKLLLFEVAGLAALAWFVVRNRLWEPARLWAFLRTGRPGLAQRETER
ncbi:MAG: metal-dependent hydrolase [Anaerolineae bacterium]|nr:metal-dependent hydrolase [Anaerolineae bacterium]